MKTTPVDPRMRASRRAAAGRAVARLIARGLVECGLQRGTWKLTNPGVKVCKGLWPEILPWSKWELVAAIAQRKTTQDYLDLARIRLVPVFV
jgi:N-acyl-L-homoserine lactone synthetase